MNCIELKLFIASEGVVKQDNHSWWLCSTFPTEATERLQDTFGHSIQRLRDEDGKLAYISKKGKKKLA